VLEFITVPSLVRLGLYLLQGSQNDELMTSKIHIKLYESVHVR